MKIQQPPISSKGFVLHPVELDADIVASLNSTLKLLAYGGKREWRIQADAGAPVYITHTHSEFARRMRSAGPGRPPAPPCLVVYEAGDGMPPETFRLQRPFRAASVLEVLERLGDALAGGSPGAAHAQAPPTTLAPEDELAVDRFRESGLDSFMPSAFDGQGGEFALQLAAMLADPGDASLLEGVYEDGSMLVADQTTAKFSADPRALEHLQAGRMPESSVLRVGPAKRSSTRRTLPIDELVWCTALASAALDVLRVPDADTELVMVRWPPFGRLDGSHQHFKLAAALAHRQLNLERLIQVSGVEQVVAERFAAACLFAGFAHAGAVRSRLTEPSPTSAAAATKRRSAATSQPAMQGRKIVFAGSEGAGKTTAIRAISEVDGINTEVAVSGPARGIKASTTVAMDYGQTVGIQGTRLMLYGTPGQQRFAFMWKVAAKGADGVVILINNAAADPLGDLQRYIDGFAAFGKRGAAVIGIGRSETHIKPSLEEHARVAAAHGWRVPVLAVDARERADVQLMLDLLCVMIDAVDEGQS